VSGQWEFASGTGRVVSSAEIESIQHADFLDLARNWNGMSATDIGEGAVNALIEALELDFVILRLEGAGGDFVRSSEAFARDVGQDNVVSQLTLRGAFDASSQVDQVAIDGIALSLVRMQLGAVSSIGCLVAGARRATFPSTLERHSLRIAALQATLIFRELRDADTHDGDHVRIGAENAPRPSQSAPQQSESGLNLIINTIPAMAWSATPDGMLDFCNQHLLDFVGLPFEKIAGSGFYSIFHPDDTPHMASAWREIVTSKSSREVEARIRSADGEYRWFTLRQNPLLNTHGEVVKWYGIVLDIEDRKRAIEALKVSEAALSASERNLRLILDSLPVLAWSARPDGGADFVNQRWLDYAGVPADQILEWGFLNFYHPDDIAGMVEIWKRDLERSDQTTLKGRIRGADGQYRLFLFQGRKITHANGVVRWFGANLDIEDLQRAEDKLRASQTDLAHMTRMTTMGELTVSIAHEVNQPLMAIVTNAGTCLRWLDEAQLDIELARKAAERIVRDGHRAGDILASIRGLARKTPPLMVPMDIKDAIEEVRELLKGELQRRGVESLVDYPRSPVSVSGDRTQLQQVILNLVMNGVEAMAENALECRRLVIQVQTASEEFAEVHVADWGTGLDVDHADRIFDAFFSTKPGGIGMGLSICRSIVEAHGGRIWAADNERRGSIFCFTVPLA
jgi:PAS domain S-box-containing protein